MLQFAEHERGAPLPAHVTVLPAMAKYGVNSEPACFASSIGVRSRRDAMTLGAMFPPDFGTDFQFFTAWVSTLDVRDVRDSVGGATAALFLDRAATLLTPAEALESRSHGRGDDLRSHPGHQAHRQRGERGTYGDRR